MYVFYIYFFIFGAQKHFSASYGFKKIVFWFIYQIEVISKLEIICTLLEPGAVVSGAVVSGAVGAWCSGD